MFIEVNLTPNEIEMLKCICNSDYHDGRHPVDDPQWFDHPFETARVASGVCSSLSKKGYAWFNDVGTDEHCMCITQSGFDKLAKADPEFVKKFQRS